MIITKNPCRLDFFEVVCTGVVAFVVFLLEEKWRLFVVEDCIIDPDPSDLLRIIGTGEAATLLELAEICCCINRVRNQCLLLCYCTLAMIWYLTNRHIISRSV